MTGQTKFTTAIALTSMAAACSAVSHQAAAQADSSLTLYGRFNTGLEVVRTQGQGEVTRLSNYRSVLGFKGEEALGGGLKAVWQLEGPLALGTGAGSSITNRDTRLGLAGAWGTVFAGVWTLPYTAATSGFDPFYPTTAGYMAIMGNGSASLSNNVQNTSAFDRRQSNQIQYWSPSFAGITVRLGYAVNEETVEATGAKPWLASGSISYEQAGANVTVAVEQHDDYQAKGTSDTAAKIGAAYAWGPARLAAVIERLKYGTPSGSLKRDAWYLSGTYRIGQGTLKAGYARAGDGTGTSLGTIGAISRGPGSGASHYTVGYDHALSKRTVLQAFYSQVANGRQAAYDFAINEAGASTGGRTSLLSVGLRHNF